MIRKYRKRGLPNTCGHLKRPHKSNGMCGSCTNQHYLDRNPRAKAKAAKRMREWTFAKKYGIDAAEFDAMAAAQGHVCKLCMEPPNGRYLRLQVDHDHKTGKIRGLLCWHCNYRIIGKLESSPGMLGRIVEYL